MLRACPAERKLGVVRVANIVRDGEGPHALAYRGDPRHGLTAQAVADVSVVLRSRGGGAVNAVGAVRGFVGCNDSRAGSTPGLEPRA